MVYLLRENGEIVESRQLNMEMLNALGDDTRLNIIRKLAEGKSYPTEIAENLNISKQKAYYHFDLLEESGLIEEKERKEKSGGVARYFEPASGSFHLDLGKKGRDTGFVIDEKLENFLSPLIHEGKLDGKIVVGSPDQHGPDQVRARDGYLVGDICMKLGSMVKSQEMKVFLDTEIIRDENFEQNMLILGGVLTNSVARKFNESFPVKFEGEEFPYRRIETPENSYSSPEIGFIARAENPEEENSSLFIVAGVRNRGTETAVRAFKQLGEIINQDSQYVVVEGLDIDGDGRIDDFKVKEVG